MDTQIILDGVKTLADEMRTMKVQFMDEFQKVNSKLDHVTERVDHLEDRFDGFEDRFIGFDGRLSVVETKLDRVIEITMDNQERLKNIEGQNLDERVTRNKNDINLIKVKVGFVR